MKVYIVEELTIGMFVGREFGSNEISDVTKEACLP
jgi:hypothetical protein